MPAVTGKLCNRETLSVRRLSINYFSLIGNYVAVVVQQWDGKYESRVKADVDLQLNLGERPSSSAHFSLSQNSHYFHLCFRHTTLHGESFNANRNESNSLAEYTISHLT